MNNVINIKRYLSFLSVKNIITGIIAKRFNIRFLFISTILMVVLVNLNIITKKLNNNQLPLIKGSFYSHGKIEDNILNNSMLFRFANFEKLEYPKSYAKLPTDFQDYDYNSTTVISVYLELNQSKHSVGKYDNWLRNFALSLRAPLAIVVNEKAYEKIKRYLENSTVAKFYVVKDIWAVLNQAAIERKMSYVPNYKLKQHDLDPEKNRHNPNLYALWNMKCYIAYKISQNNPFNSSFFVFTDAGAFRDGVKPYWPDVKFISKSLKPRLREKVLLSQINKTSMEYFNENMDIIQGAFIGGTARALEKLYHIYFQLHDMKLLNGEFVGKEQTLMNLLSFKYHRKSIVRLKAWQQICLNEYDVWFYYISFLSVNASAYCTSNRERLLLNGINKDAIGKTAFVLVILTLISALVKLYVENRLCLKEKSSINSII